jgi:hypothetical protein
MHCLVRSERIGVATHLGIGTFHVETTWSPCSVFDRLLFNCSPEHLCGSNSQKRRHFGWSVARKVQFTSGAFAETKDLEFMYAFNVGGTMTESSNYDAAPPVPPAYGVWKKVGVRKYQAKYQFFQSKAVTTSDELVKAGGWGPDGYGILSQKMTLSADGNAFDSRITLELFDKHGKPATGGGEGTATGQRIK